MKVIIAEKPSVARDIAVVVGATTPKEGYIEGGGYAVTWAFGHLVGLAMPEQYGITGFRRENLPILPKEFVLVPRQVREGKEYRPDPGAVRQLRLIGELFARADEIIVATDAGREGELIFRYIYNYVGSKIPFRRLWISSLTDRAIRDGFQTLRPGNDYDNLYYSAEARSRADWLVGINASQALSITAGSGSWSLGRVQTPTLAMICSRYLENRDFTPQTYFRLKAHTSKQATAFAVLSAYKYDTRPAADQTLTIAQALYEAKKISYPRTGSRYISADVMEEIPHLIAMLRSHPKFGAYIDGRPDTRLNLRPVDDEKVTDHHALIITEDPATGLSADERIIYDMVAGRMVEAFGEACVKENTAVTLDASGVHFTSKGSITLHPGWRNVWGASQEETPDEDLTMLPDLAEGETLTLRDVEVQERQTKPRPLHTEATLLAAIIETLFSRDYIRREKKSLVPTDKGLSVYLAVRDRKIADVAMTGAWELALSKIDKGEMDATIPSYTQVVRPKSKIDKGEMDAATFHRSIEVYASQITSELRDMPFERRDNRQSCPCPKCGSGSVVMYAKVAKCNNETCGLTVWRTIAKKELSDTQIAALLTGGKTGIIKGFVSAKTGNPFDAAVAFDSDYKTVFVFEERKGRKVKKGKSR